LIEILFASKQNATGPTRPKFDTGPGPVTAPKVSKGNISTKQISSAGLTVVAEKQ